MLSSHRDFPFYTIVKFFWPETYIWQLTAEMRDELPAKQQIGRRLMTQHLVTPYIAYLTVPQDDTTFSQSWLALHHIWLQPAFRLELSFWCQTALNLIGPATKFDRTGWHAVSRLIFYILTKTRFSSFARHIKMAWLRIFKPTFTFCAAGQAALLCPGQRPSAVGGRLGRRRSLRRRRTQTRTSWPSLQPTSASDTSSNPPWWQFA